jgi:hypothetical protein
MVAMTILISPVNKVLADSPGNISQQQLQGDLAKYSYPYSEVSVNEREQLAQYEINTLNQQVANFQPLVEPLLLSSLSICVLRPFRAALIFAGYFSNIGFGIRSTVNFPLSVNE